MSSVNQPMLVFDEKHAIDRTTIMVAAVRHTLAKEYSPEYLGTALRQGLREGGYSLATQAALAGDNGDEIADAALRDVFGEMVAGVLERHTEGHFQIWAYGHRASKRDRAKRPRGHRWYDDWIRNLHACFLVCLACREFGVRPTRNRESRRARQDPSGVSLVVAGLARNGIHMEESSFQRHVWLGLPGELARQVIAERPPETFFR